MAEPLPKLDMSSVLQSEVGKNQVENAGLVFDISNEEFFRIRDYLQEKLGIQLGLSKKQMVASRLAKRIRYYHLSSYGDYFQQSIDGTLANECQVLLDLLTTNETYLFREPAHFEYLRKTILVNWKRGRLFRAWSAASSSGEEAYSMSMVIADHLGDTPWEVMGSDVSTQILKKARKGQYPMTRIEHISKAYLQKYCLKGVRSQNGTLLMNQSLRQRVQFQYINLNSVLPDVGQFDVIFLRNVLIYFDAPTRQAIVKRLLSRLRSGGYFFVSHTETITGIFNQLEVVAPSVYQKR